MRAVFVPWFIKRVYAVPSLKPGEWTWLSAEKHVTGVMFRTPSGVQYHFFEAAPDIDEEQTCTITGDEDNVTVTDAHGIAWIVNGEWA